MAQFLLLLHNDPAGWEKLSPDAAQAAVAKYMAWGQKPFNLGGKRLGEDTGKVMRADNGEPHVTDGPYSETKEILGGYYLIEAANYAEAVERSKDHPHLEHGTIEVRHVYGT